MAEVHAPWCKIGLGRQNPLSRRTAIIGSFSVLAAALTGCSDDPDPDTDPADPQPDIAAAPVPQPDTEIGNLLETAPNLAVAGQPVNVGLLKHFYARHDFQPVWDARQAQANSLVNAVLRAGDQGLDPDLFHGNLLRHTAPLSPLDRDVLLSDAFLSYADALARGAVPLDRRRDDETLTPEPIDIAAALDAAIDSPDPGAAIEALAPTTPTYGALRQALQKSRSAGDINRMHLIEVNLERQRWLPRPLPTNRAWVNIADERLTLYRAGLPVFSAKVVVGQDIQRNQSPEFRATIDASFFNPPWVVPADIVTREILPKISRDPNYLKRNDMIMLANGEAEQLPGPDAGLGYIMFDMPNRFDVFLHDTPGREIFNHENRRISHGCIRVQNPRQLAALLLQEPIEAINQGIAAGGTTRHNLPTPVPVFVVYQTAFLGTDGTLQFRPDFYNRDADIWQKLQPHPPQRTPAA